MIAALIIGGIIAIVLLIFAVCDTASDADDRLEEMAYLDWKRRQQQ